MSFTLRVGFVGKGRAGKDTAHLWMQEKLSEVCNVRRFSFADPLKDMYCASTSMSREELEADKEVHRPLLKALGAAGRKHDEDIWLNLALNTSKNIEKNQILLFEPKIEIHDFTDPRFYNEHAKMDITFYIHRPNYPCIEDCGLEIKPEDCTFQVVNYEGDGGERMFLQIFERLKGRIHG